MSLEVLLADDDDSIRLVLSKALSRAGHTVRATDNAATLLRWAESGKGDIVLTDVLMDGKEVFDTLPDLAAARPDMPVVVISANNTVTTALKSGAHKVFEYIPKPFDLDDVTGAVARAGQGLKGRAAGARKRKSRDTPVPMVGRSPAMQPIYRAISRYADTALPVLITGPVGSGKDLVARLLHEGGRRADRPFLRTDDFTNLSLTLQKANGGDIFVDEIAGLSPEQQGALLALMTEAESIPDHSRPRVLSTTRKDLRALAEDGTFRDDLVFRLNVAEIRVPSLRERAEDIPALAQHFLSATPGGETRQIESDALDVLSRHDWRGNVRELENLVRRLGVLYSDDVISAAMILDELDKDIVSGADAGDSQLEAVLKVACRRLVREGGQGGDSPHQVATEWVERPLIQEALRLTGGNRARAAEVLGIHRNTLRTRLASLNLD